MRNGEGARPDVDLCGCQGINAGMDADMYGCQVPGNVPHEDVPAGYLING